MTKPAGYSGTPLAKKLGIGAGQVVATIDAPEHYAELLGELPPGAKLQDGVRGKTPFVHVFTTKKAGLSKSLPRLGKAIFPDGVLWISWPKKSAGVPTDVTEDVIREVALPLGLVDVKVCAVDETWSGLKLMWRKERRGSA